MSKLYCGCCDFPRDRRSFLKIATAIEHRVGLFTPPKARVLKSWAEATAGAENPMRVIWVAWQAFTHRPADIHKGYGAKILDGESPANFGHFQKTSENMRLWSHIKLQAQNVGASRILLETSANFTPSDNNKRALREFTTNWADLSDGVKLIWHPAGFWEREEALRLTNELGMILAIDPLVDEREGLPDCAETYFQMLGRHGLMDSYSDDDLEYLLDCAAQFDDCTITFRTRDTLADAKHLISLNKTYTPTDPSDDDDDDFDEEFDEEFDDEEEESDDFDNDDDDFE